MCHTNAEITLLILLKLHVRITEKYTTWKCMDIPLLWLHILLFLHNEITESSFLQNLA